MGGTPRRFEELKIYRMLRAGGEKMRFKLLASVVLSALCFVAPGLSQERASSGQTSDSGIGLAVGTKAPSFSLRDQSGRVQTNQTLRGMKGTVLLFFRSADWCPYCKAQLMDLQRARARFEQQGLKLAAISYDTVEILKSFADRRQIEYPMLADPDSQIIRAYGVLNAEATGRDEGMARPGYFFIDPSGTIREKFFETSYQERDSANSVIARLFPELAVAAPVSVNAQHIGLTIAQSDRAGAPGSRISLIAEVKLAPRVHVYAPGAQGYRPIELKIQPAPEFTLASPTYPKSKELYLPAIQERVQLYEGTFRVTQDVTISYSQDFIRLLGTDGKAVEINGEFRYQACDDKICYLPTSVPVKWQVQVLPLDRQRAPEAIQHK
jgi:peroxiredoxin